MRTFHSVHNDFERHIQTDGHLDGRYLEQTQRLRLGPRETVQQPAAVGRRQPIKLAADDV